MTQYDFCEGFSSPSLLEEEGEWLLDVSVISV